MLTIAAAAAALLAAVIMTTRMARWWMRKPQTQLSTDWHRLSLLHFKQNLSLDP